MEEVTCIGGVHSPEAPLEGCCVPGSFQRVRDPGPYATEVAAPPHLRGVPHRPLSALLAPG